MLHRKPTARLAQIRSPCALLFFRFPFPVFALFHSVVCSRSWSTKPTAASLWCCCCPSPVRVAVLLCVVAVLRVIMFVHPLVARCSERSAAPFQRQGARGGQNRVPVRGERTGQHTITTWFYVLSLCCVQLNVSSDRAFALHLRIPAWCANATVFDGARTISGAPNTLLRLLLPAGPSSYSSVFCVFAYPGCCCCRHQHPPRHLPHAHRRSAPVHCL